MIETAKTGEVYGLYPDRTESERKALADLRSAVAEALDASDYESGMYDSVIYAAKMIEYLAENGWMIVSADSLIL